MSVHMNKEPSRAELWTIANQDLMARSLSEFIYEEELSVERITDKKYQVTLTHDVVYEFKASPTLWHSLTIEPTSIVRNKKSHNDALQFCLDLKAALTVDDIIFGNWLEDVQNTLNNDFYRRLTFAKYSAKQLLQLPEIELQGLLDAHPKIIANRGRIGWGDDANQTYAPESLNKFQLVYLAANKKTLTAGHSDTTNNKQLLLSMMSETQHKELLDLLEHNLRDSQYSVDDYRIMPCHPWQFQHSIKPQFRWALETEQLVDLGTTGDYYQAQQSIRTLSNVTRPECFDLKLALTMLNTSCYRGVPEKFIAAGYKISSWLNQLAQQDPLFKQANFRILEEPAGYYFSHAYQKQVTQTPYRYHEMLGCIWRQSSYSKYATNEQTSAQSSETHLLLSALLQSDTNGHSLVSELVEHSGLSAEAWLEQLFAVMAVPLYHLLVKYGVGVIAHGQNVVVYFDNATPKAVAIKDFHGDLRLIDQQSCDHEFTEQASLDAEARELLSKLPAEYLVHDLLTGHFISVYRFLSPLYAKQLNISEARFYELLASKLFDYQQQHPQYAERFKLFDLFKQKVERVCLNKVRFVIGYEDNAERPLPTLESPMTNPIFKGLQSIQIANQYISEENHNNDSDNKHSSLNSSLVKDSSETVSTIQNSNREQLL